MMKMKMIKIKRVMMEKEKIEREKDHIKNKNTYNHRQVVVPVF
jgi:hypothetical protein